MHGLKVCLGNGFVSSSRRQGVLPKCRSAPVLGRSNVRTGSFSRIGPRLPGGGHSFSFGFALEQHARQEAQSSGTFSKDPSLVSSAGAILKQGLRNTRFSTVSAGMICILTGVAIGGDWPAFRGPDGNGIAREGNGDAWEGFGGCKRGILRCPFDYAQGDSSE